MGLLDGALASSFASVFGAFYLDGTLHRITRMEDAGGSITNAETDVAIKGQVDQVSEAMRVQAGYTEKEQRLIVLSAVISPAPTSQDEITLGGTRWAIAAVEADPVSSHWVIRGQRA